MARKLGDRLMIEDADHDCIDISRQHPRGIGERFTASQLHFLGGEKGGLPAELSHGDIERYPGPRRWLVEHHRQCFSGKRRAIGAASALPLHGLAQIDQMAKDRLRDVDQIQKMPDAVRGHDATLAARACVSASFAQARSMHPTACVISFSPIMRGGSSRTTLSPAATVIIFSARNWSTISEACGIMRRPISRPSPRTSAMIDEWRSLSSASRCLSSKAFLRMRSRKPGAITTSRTALPTAMASGLPPKVEPCVPTVIPFEASAVARQAPIGKPPPRAFASAMTSGFTPLRS